MEVQFHIDKDTINTMSWEEFEAFERAQDGDLKLYQIRPVLARFMVDTDGKHIDHKKAMQTLGKLPVDKVQEVVEIFTEAIKDGVVPKASGNSLNSPSEAPSAVSEFPDGSAS